MMLVQVLRLITWAFFHLVAALLGGPLLLAAIGAWVLAPRTAS